MGLRDLVKQPELRFTMIYAPLLYSILKGGVDEYLNNFSPLETIKIWTKVSSAVSGLLTLGDEKGRSVGAIAEGMMWGGLSAAISSALGYLLGYSLTKATRYLL
ncbi:MAG: hypothetical protein GXO63_01430 [Candidatus Micrarchaeota archaeon]|nr:hypothetical protein [Candidatus Micrarchaeota archaeon]